MLSKGKNQNAKFKTEMQKVKVGRTHKTYYANIKSKIKK